jgi:uncharacterized protein YydD (DUF2326 family)
MYFHLPYRQTEKVLHKAMLKENAFHTRLYYNKQRRINKLDVKIKDVDNKDKDFEDMYITIAIDSNGIRLPIEANGL